MMTRDGDHVGFTPGHQLTKIRGPDRLKCMKWFQSSQAACGNEAMSLLTCELRAKLPAIVISDFALLDAAQGESWVHSKKNCAISPFVCMPLGCATECAGMSVQEFNDEAEDVRKAKQTQLPTRALYTIGESLLRNTDRTQPQSRREDLDYESMKTQLRSDRPVINDSVCTLDSHSVRVSLYDNENRQANKISQLRDYTCPGDTTPQLVSKANLINNGPGQLTQEFKWGTATEKVRAENARD